MDYIELKQFKRSLFKERLNWYDYLIESGRLMGEKKFTEKSARCNERWLLFINRNKWTRSHIQAKINKFSRKIDSLGFHGPKKPRTLWLPTVIENADMSDISIVAYPSVSVRSVTLKQAEDLIIKHELKDKVNKKMSYKASYPSGYNYKIHVEYLNEITLYPLTEWVVCVCDKNEMPSFTLRIKDKSAKSTTPKKPKVIPVKKRSIRITP